MIHPTYANITYLLLAQCSVLYILDFYVVYTYHVYHVYTYYVFSSKAR